MNGRLWQWKEWTPSESTLVRGSSSIQGKWSLGSDVNQQLLQLKSGLYKLTIIIIIVNCQEKSYCHIYKLLRYYELRTRSSLNPVIWPNAIYFPFVISDGVPYVRRRTPMRSPAGPAPTIGKISSCQFSIQYLLTSHSAQSKAPPLQC